MAFVIFFIFTAVFNTATKVHNKTVLFHQLILLQLVSCICVQGGMTLFSYGDIGGNLALIVFFVAYFLFKFDYKHNLKS